MPSVARADCRGAVVDGRERRQVEAERHDAVLIGAADAVLAQQLVADGRRNRDDAIGAARQQPFDADEHARS